MDIRWHGVRRRRSVDEKLKCLPRPKSKIASAEIGGVEARQYLLRSITRAIVLKTKSKTTRSNAVTEVYTVDESVVLRRTTSRLISQHFRCQQSAAGSQLYRLNKRRMPVFARADLTKRVQIHHDSLLCI